MMVSCKEAEEVGRGKVRVADNVGDGDGEEPAEDGRGDEKKRPRKEGRKLEDEGAEGNESAAAGGFRLGLNRAHSSISRGATPGDRDAPFGMCSTTTSSGTICRPSSTANWEMPARGALHQQSPTPSHGVRAAMGDFGPRWWPPVMAL